MKQVYSEEEMIKEEEDCVYSITLGGIPSPIMCYKDVIVSPSRGPAVAAMHRFAQIAEQGLPMLSKYQDKILESATMCDHQYATAHPTESQESPYDYENVFYAPHTWMYNFGHFLFDVIPRYHWWDSLKQKIPDLKIMLPTRIRHSPGMLTGKINFILDFFDLYGIGEEDLIWSDSFEPYGRIKNIYMPDHTEMRKCPKPAHTTDLELAVKKMKEIVKNKDTSHIPTYDKIYVSRRDATKGNSNAPTRRPANEDEVWEHFKGLGYKELFNRDLSWVEKIVIYGSAKEIAGPTGANMLNCYFAQGADIIILSGQDLPQWKTMAKIATFTNSHVDSYVFPNGELLDPDHGMHSFHVDISRLERGDRTNGS